MERRFTLLQGGLTQGGRREAQRACAARAERVRLLRPLEIGPADAAAWRGLAAACPDPCTDPFADPDYLLTAALNAPRDAAIVFAFAYGAARGGETLRGVVPLTVPHPVWGGSAYRLWQPALAPRPVEPLCEAGAQAEVMHAVLRHLVGSHPRAALRFSRIAAGSRLLSALAGDDRLRIAVYRRSVPAQAPVEADSSASRDASDRADGVATESVTARPAIRDAVERFLLADAAYTRDPLISQSEAASIVRVVTRAFARRDAVSVELDRCGEAIVGGAIRLGPTQARVLWRSVNRPEPRGEAALADLVIALAEPAAITVPRTQPRLVAP